MSQSVRWWLFYVDNDTVNDDGDDDNGDDDNADDYDYIRHEESFVC
jgi:hypothetical protein